VQSNDPAMIVHVLDDELRRGNGVLQIHILPQLC
jgi:hypothetical protein